MNSNARFQNLYRITIRPIGTKRLFQYDSCANDRARKLSLPIPLNEIGETHRYARVTFFFFFALTVSIQIHAPFAGQRRIRIERERFARIQINSSWIVSRRFSWTIRRGTATASNGRPHNNRAGGWRGAPEPPIGSGQQRSLFIYLFFFRNILIFVYGKTGGGAHLRLLIIAHGRWQVAASTGKTRGEREEEREWDAK